MRFLNYLNRFRQTLSRGGRHQRPRPLQRRPQLELLEDRLVPSTLQADFGLGGKIVAHYTASPGVANNVTLSQRLLPIISSGQPIHFLLQDVITDTSEKIDVVGTAASAFAGNGTNSVATIQPMQSLFVDVLDGTDVVNVKAINYATTVRHIGAGVDTVNVGDGGSLLGIQGSLGVTEAGAASVTHLNIDDSVDKANLTKVLLFGGQINNLAPTLIAYNALNASSTVTITGGSGTDTYLVDAPLAATTIVGGSGSNTLVSGPAINDWTITGINAGTLHNVSFTNIQNLRGGTGSVSDTFHFNDKAGVTGTIAGVPGSSTTLDYSKYTTAVTVDLKLNLALAGGITTHVFNIRNVFGGQGNNILVGDGNNFLRGGNGRNILISGGGFSTLQAGGGEAILLGAHTVFDTNLAALSAIMAEWSHTYDPINPLHDYQIRVSHLEHGGGLNGPFVLNASTVFAQPGVTRLIGGAPFDFFIVDAGDIFAPRPGEVVLPV